MRTSGSDMNIAFFVSAHGFGHAARAAAVMSAVRRHEPDVGLEVFTRVPGMVFFGSPFVTHPLPCRHNRCRDGAEGSV